MVRSLGGGDADVLFRIWLGADDDEMEAAGIERDEGTIGKFCSTVI